MKLNLLLVSLCLILACNKKFAESLITIPNQEMQIGKVQTYLALGDSYTIGEAVPQNESFPFQLQAQLNLRGFEFAVPKVVAKTGWTTEELQLAIKKENISSTFDMVTLLIGVNNQYRGQSQTIYRKEFKALLQQAIDFANGNKNRVFVISIPDWGVTTFGQNSGRSQQTIAQEIDAFNVINKEETEAKQVTYINITPESRNAASDLSLVAADGLHPAGKMYAAWAAKVAAVADKNLRL